MTRTQALTELERILRMRHYAESTIDNYVHWTGRFFRWLAENRDCAPPPRARMEGFLSALADDECSASTQNQAFNAILFFFRNVVQEEPGDVNALRARRPKFARHAPSRDQVRALFAAAQDSPAYPYKLIMKLIYGSGLRVSEAIAIRAKDLDFSNGRMVIRQAKGAKDRFAPIPPSLIDPLRRQVEASLAVLDRAIAAKIPAKLPHRLSIKYQTAGFQRGWWWIFPAPHPCIDPSDPDAKRKVWWHCLDKGVQKAMRLASIRAGLPMILTPHHL